MNTRADEKCDFTTSILIVGGGPVGLALASELGWRGVPCLLIEQSDGAIFHPRANTVDPRVMEFCRRWGISEIVERSGTADDYPGTAIYVTSLNGYELARFERPGPRFAKPLTVSPEKPQRCNQLWFDPILRDLARRFPPVQLRYRCRFESFVQDDDRVVAEVRDLETGRIERIEASYLVACDGGRSPIRDTLGIGITGQDVMGYPVDIHFRMASLWDYHDKGKAFLHYIVGPQGVWSTLIALDGNELWRITLHGSEDYLDPELLDVAGTIRRVIGVDIPCEVVSVAGWVRREFVADRFQSGRVFLAGDCAHQNSPSGGYGMNTGIGDIADLGWKLAAVHQGWAGSALLDSYETERRPVAIRNVRAATDNFEARNFTAGQQILDATPAGERTRREIGLKLKTQSAAQFQDFGVALGFSYEGSPICCAEQAGAPTESSGRYIPSTRPGCRAPHGWMADGRSTIDLFGRSYMLLRLGADAPFPQSMVEAAERAGMPFEIVALDQPDICTLYERKLVLVRPDGHVAWRSDVEPSDADSVIDRVRGALPALSSVDTGSSERSL